jgi:hypothetical protein
MRMKYWLPVVVLAAMTWACGDDDGNTGNQSRTIVFSVPEDYLGKDEGWIVASDATGNVLETTPMEPGTDYTFDIPAAISENSVTLTLIRNIMGMEGERFTTTINTYTDVAPGNYGFAVLKWGSEPDGKASTFVLTDGIDDMGSHAWVFPVGRPPASLINELGDGGVQITTQPFVDKSALLLISSAKPFKYLYTEIEPAKEYTRTAADIKAGVTKTLEVPDAGRTLIYLRGSNAMGLFSYFNFVKDGPRRSTSVDVPLLPDVFSSYNLSVDLQQHDVGKSWGFVWNDKTLPDRIEMLDATVEEIAVRGESISCTAKASEPIDAAGIGAVYAVQDGFWVEWNVWGAGGNQSITPPHIPAEIPMSIEGDDNVRSFIKMTAAGQYTVTLVASPEYETYRDYTAQWALSPDRGGKTEHIKRFWQEYF